MSVIANFCEQSILTLLKNVNQKTIQSEADNDNSQRNTNDVNNNPVDVNNNNSQISLHQHEHNMKQKKHWYFLVSNKTCALKITTLISKSKLISQNIIEIQFIESTNRKKESFPVLYFIDLNPDTLKMLSSDLKNKVYKETRIIIANIPSLIKRDQSYGKYIEYDNKSVNKLYKLAKNPSNNIINIECIQIGFKHDFFNLLEPIDCIYTSLVGFFDFLNLVDDETERSLSYRPNFLLQKRDNSLSKLFREYDYLREFNKSKSKNIDIIKLDRNFDMITPLLHFFTFFPLLNTSGLVRKLDILNKEGERTKATLLENSEFRDFAFKHIAHITTQIPQRLEALVEKTNKIDQTTNTSELARMVLEAPILLKQKEETEILIDLVEKCVEKFSSQLSEIAEMQNQIVLSEKGSKIDNGTYDIDRIKMRSKLKEFLKKKKYGNKSKIAMILVTLYLVKYYIHCKYTKEELLEDIKGFSEYFKKSELTNLQKHIIKNINSYAFRKSEMFIKDFEFDVSIIKPRLELFLEEFFKNGSMPGVSGTGTATESLRKGGFLTKKSGLKRKVVLCIDWVCAKEIEICEVIGHRYNVDIVIMAEYKNPDDVLKLFLGEE